MTKLFIKTSSVCAAPPWFQSCTLTTENSSKLQIQFLLEQNLIRLKMSFLIMDKMERKKTKD